MTQHDTPEAVEVIVRKLTDLHFPPREAAAAMLRRLLKRAVDAEARHLRDMAATLIEDAKTMEQST